ncbi:hypothetical protein KVT40_007475 [Elsinoe batatas]|uniref:Uncharacterized protein n=1 Tax=Elsinoe batatas TaxID=2601811 RepID=A0A8K0KXG9_9PEZI|nr:hypothetical protein KVT40_007475 [Elsinoe batatas]
MSVPINITKKPLSSPSSSSNPPPKPTYFSNGRALSSPPLSARAKSLLSTIYCFIGLYLTTLFSLDSTAAAQGSPFAKSRGGGTQGRGSFPKPTFWGGSGGGGGDGRGPGGGGSGGSGGGKGWFGGAGGGGGRKLGTVDGVRGPECGSCQ